MIMEYQEIINLLGNEVTQPSKCRTKIWVEIIGDAHRMQNTNSQIKLKITMLKSSVCEITIMHTYLWRGQQKLLLQQINQVKEINT